MTNLYPRNYACTFLLNGEYLDVYVAYSKMAIIANSILTHKYFPSYFLTSETYFIDSRMPLKMCVYFM